MALYDDIIKGVTGTSGGSQDFDSLARSFIVDPDEERKRRRAEQDKNKAANALDLGRFNQAVESGAIGAPEPSLRDKIAMGVGSFIEAAGQGLNQFSRGVARALPGGEADVEAERVASERQSEDVALLVNEIRSTSDPAKRDRLKRVLSDRIQSGGGITATLESIRDDTDKRKFLAATAELGLLAATGVVGRLATGAKAGKGFVAAGEAPKLATQAPLLQRAARAGAVFGAEGAAVGTAQGLQQDDPTLGSVATSAGTGAALGVGLGAGLPLVGGGVQAFSGAVRRKGAKTIDDVALKASDAEPNDLNAFLNDAIDTQTQKYKKGVVDKAKDFLRRNYDPYADLVRIDRAYAKKKGIKYNDLPAEQRLEHMADVALRSTDQAAAMLKAKTRTGLSAEDLIKKYGEGTDAGREFNNFTNAMFDIEFRTKHKGRRIMADIEDADLARFVREYMAKNPDAMKDLQTKKAVNDMAVDNLVKAGVISKKEAEVIKGSYKTAVPLERVFPEDLARPEIGGRSIGSISKQTVVQTLEGNSQIPLSNSFDPLVNRIKKSVAQGNRAKLARAYLERVQQGVAKGDLVVGAGNKEARAAVRADIAAVNKATDLLSKKLKLSKRDVRRLETELNKLNKQGLQTRLKGGGSEPLPDFAPEALPKLSGVAGKTKNTRAFIKSLISEDVGRINQIRAMIANREPKLAAKLDEVVRIKSQIEANKLLKKDLREVSANLVDDPTTGKQMISGIIDGQKFQLEVPPDIAKTLQGLEETKLEPLVKGIELATRVYKTTWTGALNPIFSGISFALYDTPMSIINSRLGFRTLAPKAIKESFKSLNSNSEFQQKLAAAGAQHVGASELGTGLKLDAKAISARRSLLDRVKYSATNPVEALHSLDVFGGKLANVTRTRVARAHYDDAVKRGLSEDAAMAEAAYAYNNVMPNFARMSPLVRTLNGVLPYFSASIAGARSLNKALRNNPATTLKLLAIGAVPVTATAAFSMSSEAGQEFYKDMVDSKKEYLLDNNLVIVLPGASKDKVSGEWSGIVKIPIPPEMRKLNNSAWKTLMAQAGESGVNPADYALNVFDFFTGGVRQSGSPLVATGQILSGVDPRTGEPLVFDDMRDLPKSEQVFSTTSENAKRFSELVGGAISPIQADKLFGQFSIAGSVAQGRQTPVGSLEGRFSGAQGVQELKAAFNEAIGSKSSVSDQITAAIKANNIPEANRLASEFNQIVARAEELAKGASGKGDLTDKQKEILKKLRFPMHGDSLTEPAINARRRQ